MTSLTSLDISNNPNLTGAIWPPSDKLKLQVLNTNITDCSQNNFGKSANCAVMKCLRHPTGNSIALWMIVLIVITWVIILGIIGAYMYAEYNKGKIMRHSDDDEKSVTSIENENETETEADNESVITKLDGFKQNGDRYHSAYRSKHGSKSTTFSFFRRSQYSGAQGKFTDKKSYKVQQPHTPANDDELELAAGQTVKVLEQFEDGWAFGLNVTSDETGVFPLVCLE